MARSSALGDIVLLAGAAVFGLGLYSWVRAQNPSLPGLGFSGVSQFTLSQLAAIASDPSTPAAVRQQARAALSAATQQAQADAQRSAAVNHVLIDTSTGVGAYLTSKALQNVGLDIGKLFRAGVKAAGKVLPKAASAVEEAAVGAAESGVLP